MMQNEDLKLYLAPLEGITTYVYRNTMYRLFPEYIDKYYIPFIMPHIKRDMNTKERRELCRENNDAPATVPQLLTDSAKDFLRYINILSDMGYDEINLNLGCPSGTVASKGRGAGFLADPLKLDEFFDEVFSHTDHKISVKTRIGTENTEEFCKLLEVYNKYPIYELTIHPRLLTEQYRGLVHRESFMYAVCNSKNPLVYNGDIRNKNDVEALRLEMQGSGSNTGQRIMIGRGAISDPSIFRQIKGGEPLTQDELETILDEVERGYFSFLANDTQVLFRLKEMWTWLIQTFKGNKKSYKKLLKAKSLEEFRLWQNAILEEVF